MLEMLLVALVLLAALRGGICAFGDWRWSKLTSGQILPHQRDIETGSVQKLPDHLCLQLLTVGIGCSLEKCEGFAPF
jgi:hypothetical protein